MSTNHPARLASIEEKFERFLEIEISKRKKEKHQGFNYQLEILWGKKSKFIDDILKESESSLNAYLNTNATKDFESEYIKEYEKFSFTNSILSSWLNVPVKNIDNFKLILSDNYNPPLDYVTMLSHLYTVSNFYALAYKFISKIPLDLLSRVEYAALVLVNAAASFTSFCKEKGSASYRVSKSKNKKALLKEVRKQKVIEEYHRLEKKARLKPHRIAVLIRDRIKRELNISMHPDTIKAYLREESLI